MSRQANRQAPRAQADRTAESDARMLAAAVELICQKGADGATLKEVGERAGYSRGLASYRFGNKSGLYRFVVRSIGEQWLAELGATVGEKIGLSAIHAAIDAHDRFVAQADERIRAFYVLWFCSVGPDANLKGVIEHIHRRRQRDVAEWIRKGVDAGEIRRDADVATIARRFCGAIIGIVYQWLVAPDDRDLVRLLHEDLKQQMGNALRPNGD
jgi:AcrR family transcriptional regulator